MIALLSHLKLETIRWDLLFVFSETVFLFAALYAVKFISESIAAYELLIGREK